jgi:hypothetical protein
LVHGLYINLCAYEHGYQRDREGNMRTHTHKYFDRYKTIKGNKDWTARTSETFTMDDGNYSIPFSYFFPLYGDNGEQLQVTLPKNIC